MSQRISFVLSDFTTTKPPQQRATPLLQFQSFASAQQSAPGTHQVQPQQHQVQHPQTNDTQQQHTVPIPQIPSFDPPALPRRRWSSACVCLAAVVAFWCVATVGLSIVFFWQGRSLITAGTFTHHDVAAIVLPRRHRMRLARSECLFNVKTDGIIGTTRSEIIASLGLALGLADEVDTDTTVVKMSESEFRVSIVNCDASLEAAMRNESVQNAWILRLKAFRGSVAVIHQL